jgi:hypothetical protein
MALKLRRGTTSELATITPQEGELVYTIDIIIIPLVQQL